MKQAQIFRQYIWIINMLRSRRGMTFEELSRRWLQDAVSDGRPLQRSSFNRHRDAIVDTFGIIIDCDPRTYRYYIGNPESLNDDGLERWLFSTINVHGVLADSTALRDRVVLESVPAGEQYLQIIIRAIRSNRRLLLGYRKFAAEGYVKTVSPYALKLFVRRWYLLARTTEEQMRIYALDRVTSLDMTEESFTMPDDFSPQAYFAEYFGVLADQTPMAHVVIRAYGKTPDYLRTLPLHRSQRELETAEGHTDFAFDIRPTADFLGELLKFGSGIEVVQPPELRETMRQKIASMLKKY